MTSLNPIQNLLVVDDHDIVLGGTIKALSEPYPEAEARSAGTAEAARAALFKKTPNLLMLDLCIPETSGVDPSVEAGLNLLRHAMKTYSRTTIVVQSDHVKRLSKFKPFIDAHPGGFAIVEKSLPLAEMLKRVDLALQGYVFVPPSMRSRLEIRSEWLEMLRLAFNEGYRDKVIAEKMHVSERTVRHYWTKVQSVLEVYPDKGKNIRIQTGKRAREEGLID